ncbi:MAG: ATP-dependent DNA helicase RecG [Rickettsiales bacterium]|jgi:ATP-dependent DNA helicase RecG|nr:ATP-dependent DNA helicase RecG [Rickettsiales bacterium]
MDFLLSPLQTVKGVGDKILGAYGRLLNNDTPKIIDLLFLKPYRILYRLQNPDLRTLKDGDLITVNVIVNDVEISNGVKKIPCKIRCYNKTGFITILYFNYFQDFIVRNFKEGLEVSISGSVKKNEFNNELTMLHPDYINQKAPEFEQIYPLSYGLTNKMVRNTIQKCLEQVEDVELFEGNMGFKKALLELHNVKTEQDMEKFKQLSFYELLAQQLALKIIRDETKKDEKMPFIRIDKLKEKYLKQIPFELTSAQKKVITEIENDIYSNKKMLRLLQGDVGSGKTMVAFLTMLPYLENKKQVAFMCPTSILAKQHYEMLKRYSINVELLVGGTKDKKRILEKMKCGEVDVVVGTHALFQKGVEFYNLRYVIIDEQHKFGVVQRLSLISKIVNVIPSQIGGKEGDEIDCNVGNDYENCVDTIIMSATPIPRTLSLSIYGDMDLSIIDEKPQNRKEIITSSVHKTKIDDVILKIKGKIEQGEQVYWVCPLIEENEELEHIIPVLKRFEILQNIFDEQVALLHGAMKESEKDNVITNFAVGKTKVLVSTTVIEVGIDVPQATIIVIENPERFGLAQMHQLRGRVGRGNKQSYCLLLYERTSENFKKRMEILKKTSDGFKIAEEDLKLRGSGEILGKKQSGMGELKFADLFDYNLLLKVNEMVKNVSKYENLLKIFGYDKILKNRGILN